MDNTPPTKTSGLAVAGFFLSFLCSLIGLVLCLVALGDIRRSQGTLRGDAWATSGIVIAILNMCLGFILLLARHG